MNVSPFFDTNVLIYAFRQEDPRSEISRKLLAEGAVTGVQVLNEFVAIARRKLGLINLGGGPGIARSDSRPVSLSRSLTLETNGRGLHVAQRYGDRIFDALDPRRRPARLATSSAGA